MRSIPCPVSRVEFLALVQERKLTDAQIAALLPEGTIKRVQAWRLKYAIPATPRWDRNVVTPIEGQLRSLLVGSMLGDGRLVRHVNSTYYSERHCEAQRPYLEWKAGIWGPWAGTITDVPDARGYPQVHMNTCAHATLNDWQALFYPAQDRGWKRLLPEVVDMVDAMALAIWYLDDGHAGWWPMITFGSDAASRQVALDILARHGFAPRWVLKARQTGELRFDNEDQAERFLDLIRPHVPACMAYKLDCGFKGHHYQVRQALDVETLRAITALGKPIRRMAVDLGVGDATLRRYLAKHGIECPRRVGRPPIQRG